MSRADGLIAAEEPLRLPAPTFEPLSEGAVEALVELLARALLPYLGAVSPGSAAGSEVQV